jgi:hypothetical protein
MGVQRRIGSAVEEALPARSEDLSPSEAAVGGDHVRLYLGDIGKIPLLTAHEEVEIGRRIETGQGALRRALAGTPLAANLLIEVGDKLRRGEIPAGAVVISPGGEELGAPLNPWWLDESPFRAIRLLLSVPREAGPSPPSQDAASPP